MNGYYDNIFKKYVATNDLVGLKRHIDWRVKYFIPDISGENKNYDTLYIPISYFSSKVFSEGLNYAYSKNIRYGLAVSHPSEIQGMIDYNKKQFDNSTKLRFVVTEMEPYNGSCTYDEMTAVMKYAVDNGLTVHVYTGWLKDEYYLTVLKYATEINLHCYLKTYEPELIKGFTKDRLKIIGLASLKLNRKTKVNLIYSNEPKNPISGEEFGYNYFKTHSFDIPRQNFLSIIPTLTPEIKNNLILGTSYYFNTKYAKELKQ